MSTVPAPLVLEWMPGLLIAGARGSASAGTGRLAERGVKSRPGLRMTYQRPEGVAIRPGSDAAGDEGAEPSMSDIEELERRITAALDRAAKAIDRLGVAAAGDAGDAAGLAAELEAERMANAQLEERVRAIKEKQETTVKGLEAEVARLRAAVESRDGELQRIKIVNEELRRSNQALRDANARGVADPHLVNKSMMTELESLRAQRAAERAEIEEILATIEPVLKEA